MHTKQKQDYIYVHTFTAWVSVVSSIYFLEYILLYYISFTHMTWYNTIFFKSSKREPRWHSVCSTTRLRCRISHRCFRGTKHVVKCIQQASNGFCKVRLCCKKLPLPSISIIIFRSNTFTPKIIKFRVVLIRILNTLYNYTLFP